MTTRSKSMSSSLADLSPLRFIVAPLDHPTIESDRMIGCAAERQGNQKAHLNHLGTSLLISPLTENGWQCCRQSVQWLGCSTCDRMSRAPGASGPRRDRSA